MANRRAGSSWCDPEVVRHFLDEGRGSIPQGDEQVLMMLRLAQHFVPEPARVIDLGCGDGFLARAVLSAFPTAYAVMIDHSPPMLDRARKSMHPFSGRYDIRHGDLTESLAGLVCDGPFDLIVSSYAIHHLPTPRKRALYEEVFGLLAFGGMFINVEHVAPPSTELEALFGEAYIDQLVAGTGRERAVVESEYHSRADEADNILDPVEIQVGWLREIGFGHADCYFKWLELAVFGGVKPVRP